ncbi:hypothetical protein [Lactovum odontotermitis]
MDEFPKVIKAAQTSNQMLRLEFDNLELHLMHPHMMSGMMSNLQPQRKFFGLFGGNSQSSKIELQKDGSLLLNDFDIYSAEELWRNSEKIDETLEQKLSRMPTLRVKQGNEEVTVWRISRDIPQFVWIHEIFEKKKVWWVEKMTGGTFRKTDSNRANRLAVKFKEGTIYGAFGDYLIRRLSDNALSLMTKEETEKELELKLP